MTPDPVPVDVQIGYFDWLTLVVSILGIIATVWVAFLTLRATERADAASQRADKANRTAIASQGTATRAQADAMNANASALSAQTDVLREALRRSDRGQGSSAAGNDFSIGVPQVTWTVEKTSPGTYLLYNASDDVGATDVHVEAVSSRDHVEFTTGETTIEVVAPGEALSITVRPENETMPAMLISLRWTEHDVFSTVIALEL